jgi:hypothetical protein
VLFTCLAVVTGVLLARAQTGTPGDRTVAGPSSTHGTATAGTPSRPGPSPTTTSSPSATPSPSPTPDARKPSRASASPSRAADQPKAATAGKRTVTLVNRLDQTIWPAIAADPKHPVEATGWVLKPGASLSFTVPDHWDVRVWARTGCSFDAAGDGHCTTGDCGRFQCGSTWGEFPSTLAEFNLNAWNGMDFYDVSLVEGNNLPMWINSYGGSSRDKLDANGCSAAGCTRDANATCPAKLAADPGRQGRGLPERLPGLQDGPDLLHRRLRGAPPVRPLVLARRLGGRVQEGRALRLLLRQRRRDQRPHLLGRVRLPHHLGSEPLTQVMRPGPLSRRTGRPGPPRSSSYRP